jgi:hypothetical protein
VTEATPPIVEGVQSATYPGAAVDRTGGQSLTDDDAAADPRERLRTAAITATTAAADCSQEDARRRVDDGSWTTDQVASAWLAADPADDDEPATGNDPATDDDSTADNDRSASTPSTGDDTAASERTLSRTISAITAAAPSTDQSDSGRREPAEIEQ